MPDSWLLADLLLRGAVVALLGLLVAVLAGHWRKSPAIGYGLALALGMIIYVFQTAPLFETVASRALEVALVAVSNGNNPLFWFLALALFDDDFRARTWQLALWSLIVCFAAFTLLTHDASHAANPSSLHFWSHRALAWLPIVFVALTIAAAVKHWQADLVERRRWLRAFIVIAGFLYMAGTGIARLGTVDGRLTPYSSLVDILVLSVIVFVIAWRLLVLDVGELLKFRSIGSDSHFDLHLDATSGLLSVDGPKAKATAGTVMGTITGTTSGVNPAAGAGDGAGDASGDGSVAEPAHDPQELALALGLENLINKEEIYREENLTISRLAARLAVPEYRLRRLINQQLGYRNFNSFLNTYRLQHVVAAMAAPKSTPLPILTLALDAGFQSIGPFNRAFKLQYGMTPTEFRAKHSADSGIG